MKDSGKQPGQIVQAVDEAGTCCWPILLLAARRQRRRIAVEKGEEMRGRRQARDRWEEDGKGGNG